MYWIAVIGMYIAAIVIKFFSDSIPGEFVGAILGLSAPVALAIGGQVVKGVSSLLGGNKAPQLPPEVLDLLRANARKDRTSAFLPDKAAFDASTKAQIDDIFARLGIDLETFNAGAASRGTFTSGEAGKREFADVRAPAVRAAATVAGDNAIRFEQLTQRGLIAGDTANQNALSLFTSGSTPQQTGFQAFLQTLGEGGDFAAQLGILSELGVI